MKESKREANFNWKKKGKVPYNERGELHFTMLWISYWEIKFIYNKVIKGQKNNEIKEHGAGNVQEDKPILGWFIKFGTQTETTDACLTIQAALPGKALCAASLAFAQSKTGRMSHCMKSFIHWFLVTLCQLIYCSIFGLVIKKIFFLLCCYVLKLVKKLIKLVRNLAEPLFSRQAHYC